MATQSVTLNIDYNAGSNVNWVNGANTYDGNIATFGERLVPGNSADDSANYLLVTALASNLVYGDISKVEIGIYANSNVNGIVYPKFIPIFNGILNGDIFTGSVFTTGLGYQYIDITTGTNVPDIWTWEDIANLDIKTYGLDIAVSRTYHYHLYNIFLRITYTADVIDYNAQSNVNWTNGANAVDSNTGTFATRTIPNNSADDSANYLLGSAMPVVTNLGTIKKVELGFEGKANVSSSLTAKCIPIFDGIDTGDIFILPISGYLTTSDNIYWIDITTGTNAPETWTWDDIQNLDIKIYGLNVNASTRVMSINQIILKISYEEEGNIVLNETLSLSENFGITTYEIYDESGFEESGGILTDDTLDIIDIPSVRNVVASQSTIDGKVDITYELFNQGSPVTIDFQYWTGSTWLDCTTTTGEGSISLTPGEWNSKSGTWTAKTDIDGSYLVGCKIRIKTIYAGHISYWEGNTFSLDVKNPIVSLVTPEDEISQILIRFIFEIDVTDNSSYLVVYQLSILGGGDFNPIITSPTLTDIEIWDYTDIIRPLMFGTWYWRVIVTDIYQNQTISSIQSFIIEDSSAQVRVDSIEKYYDGSGLAKILFSVKDLNYEKITLRFDFTKDDGDTYLPCTIIETSDDLIINDDNYISNITATTNWVQYWIKIQYAIDTDIQLITDTLDKKNLKVRSQIIVTRDDTNYDISDIVESHSISKDKQFGASQTQFNLIDKNFEYTPLNTASDINKVSGIYNPLLYFGNIIKVIHKIFTKEGIQSFTKFTGKIKNIELVKDSFKTGINIIAQDNLEKLINYLPNNLEYNTTKQEVIDETLRTFDGFTYYSEHMDWSEYPAPKIKLNDKEIEPDKYIVDFVRGQILYKGNALSQLQTETVTCTNPLDDMKTWVAGISFDNSILPQVYYSYQRYERFSCNDYSGWLYQWTGYTEKLTENEDYYVDYENGNIILYNALDPDNSSEVLGNIKEQLIVVVYRKTTVVKALYSYEIAGSNDVEDIIKDLSIKAGIPIADIQGSVTDEILILRDQKYLYTGKNNLISLILKQDGSTVSSSDYDLDEKNGIITLDTLNYVDKDWQIEDCDWLWDDAVADTSGESVIQEIDIINQIEGRGCLKTIFPENGGYVLRDLLGDLYNATITGQKYLEFYIKANIIGIAYLDISYDNVNWESKIINVTSSWQTISWDISGLAEVYKEIKYLRLRASDIIIYLDNIYLKRNLYTASYSYYTLQATGITLSKVNFDYENVDNAFQGVQNLLKEVAPNYLVYINEDNKLIGEYSNQQLLRDSLTIWSNFNQGQRAYTRSYYGEQYEITLPKHLTFNISDEEVYTGAIVIGKNTEPENVALRGTITDECAWISGKSYLSKKVTLDRSQYNSFGRPAIGGTTSIFDQLANQNNTPIAGGVEAMNDFDTNTGMYWFKKNDAPDPNELICQLELEKAVIWERIDILVGSYDNKIIKQAFYIKVGDEFGNWWYTERNMLKIQPGSTGCYSSDTEVMTENGWMLLKDIVDQKLKIKIATLNPKTNKVEYHYPDNYFEYDYNGKMIKLENKGSNLLVTPDHNCWIAKQNNNIKNNFFAENQWKWLKGKDLLKQTSDIILRRDFPGWEGTEQEYFIIKGKINHKSGRGNNVKEFNKELRFKMDDWLKFLGLYLSEGGLTGNRFVVITQKKEDVKVKIRETLNLLGLHFYEQEYTDNPGAVKFIISKKILYNYLKQFGKAKDKFIPKELLNLSKRQLKILFDYLMLGDGWRNNRYVEEQLYYYTISLKLAKQFEEISLKLGYTTNFSIKKYDFQINKRNNCYVIALNKHPITYFRNRPLKKSEIFEEDYQGKVYCLTVPYHLLFVRRKGSGFWSGNSWVTFENNFNKDTPIKYIRIYLSEPWSWTVTTTTSGMVWESTSISVDYYYCFSIAEIEVWDKPILVAEARLDNCLLVGDGVTEEVQIPNTPFKTKDYLENRWGWINKYPIFITLYKNSYSNLLVQDVDYTYDNTTGIVSFLIPPEIGDVICGTWTLDEKHPDETTFYASFTNKELLKKIGIKLYKEEDEGLYTHQKCIDRAGLLLPELTRSIFPSNLDIVYRPDIKFGQSILLVNNELSLRRIFYIDSINFGMSEKFIPSCSIGMTSFLELKDYEYQEENPDIYKDWKIHYPKYMIVLASNGTKMIEEGNVYQFSTNNFYTGMISVDALNENGDIREDYAQECKLEVLSCEDSTTIRLLENTIKSEMWQKGIAELNFYIAWNEDGVGGRTKTPDELLTGDAWYTDKTVIFKFYETTNPTKYKTFGCKLRCILSGTLKPQYILPMGNFGHSIIYDSYSKVTGSASSTEEGKQFVTDIFDVHKILDTDSNGLFGCVTYGQTIYGLFEVITRLRYQIKYYDWATQEWVNWGNYFDHAHSIYIHPTPKLYFAGQILLQFRIGGYESGGSTYLYDGKTLTNLNIDPSYYPDVIVFNNQLDLIHPGHFTGDHKTKTRIINSDGSLAGYYEQNIGVWDGNSATSYPFIANKELYSISQLSFCKFAVWKWNSSTYLWELQYGYVSSGADIPVPRCNFEYKGKTYFIMYCSYETYPSCLCEYDYINKKLLLKGVFVNRDWGLVGSRKQLALKGNYTNVFEFQGNLYGYTGTLMKNLMPLIESSQSTEFLENQI